MAITRLTGADNSTLTWETIAAAAGDLVILIFANDGGDNQTTPSTLTRLGTNSGTSIEGGVYYRICDGNESGTLIASEASFGVSGEAYCWHCIKIPAGEWHGVTLPEMAVAGGGGTTGTINPPNLAPSWESETDNIWVVAACRDDDDGISALTADYVDNFGYTKSGTIGSCEIASSWRLNTAASEDPGNATQTNTNEEYIAWTIGVRPLTASSSSSSESSSSSSSESFSSSSSESLSSSNSLSESSSSESISGSSSSLSESVSASNSSSSGSESVSSSSSSSNSQSISSSSSSQSVSVSSFSSSESVSESSSSSSKSQSVSSSSSSISLSSSSSSSIDFDDITEDIVFASWSSSSSSSSSSESQSSSSSSESISISASSSSSSQSLSESSSSESLSTSFSSSSESLSESSSSSSSESLSESSSSNSESLSESSSSSSESLSESSSSSSESLSESSSSSSSQSESFSSSSSSESISSSSSSSSESISSSSSSESISSSSSSESVSSSSSSESVSSSSLSESSSSSSSSESISSSSSESISSSSSSESISSSSSSESISISSSSSSCSLDPTKIYSRGDYVALPGDDANLETAFTCPEYPMVAIDDDIYVQQTACDEYSLFLWKNQNDDNKSAIIVNWKGKSDRAPSLSPVYLQIYNRNTPAWETLDSNNLAAAGVEFTLSGIQMTNLGWYYDVANWVSCRIYQQAA